MLNHFHVIVWIASLFFNFTSGNVLLQGETDMAIQDRVAFACTYLSDVRLVDYLEKLNTRLTEEGNLDGILLTGVSQQSITLFLFPFAIDAGKSTK